MENRTKTVPYNNDAEMYVLGSVLLENGVMNQLVGKLNAEDFYNPQNSTIFKAMNTLHNNSEKIETVSVLEQLARDNVSNIDTLIEPVTTLPCRYTLEFALSDIFDVILEGIDNDTSSISPNSIFDLI